MPKADVVHHYAGHNSKPASDEYIRQLWERVRARLQAEKDLEAAAMEAQADDTDYGDLHDLEEKEADHRSEVNFARYGY